MNNLNGLMFLPDGRVLIMDSDLYNQTIEKSIVLDLQTEKDAPNVDSIDVNTSSTLQEEEKHQSRTKGHRHYEAFASATDAPPRKAKS